MILGGVRLIENYFAAPPPPKREPPLFRHLNLETLRLIGSGTFGNAYSVTCVVNKIEALVAVKVHKSQWDSLHEVEISTLRELELEKIPHVPLLLDHFNIDTGPLAPCAFVMSYGGPSLTTILEAAPLSRIQIRSYTRQLFKTLEGLRRLDRTHGDLSSNNVVVDKTDQVTVIDWGASCEGPVTIGELDCQPSRWCRAPEFFLRSDMAHSQIDLWSAGILLYQMVTNSLLFNTEEVIPAATSFVTVMGFPSAAYARSSLREVFHCSDAGVVTFARPPHVAPGDRSFPEARAAWMKKGGSKEEADALVGLLAETVAWEGRISPARALSHPFLSPPSLAANVKK